MKFEAVLFDLDGTLADTAPDMALAVNRMRQSRGMAPVAIELVRAQVSNGARGMLKAAFGLATDHADFGAMREEFLVLYAEKLCVETQLFRGMAELLDRLDAEGIAWGVVTNKFERLARPIIEGLQLASRARVLVGGDTCARPKPHPDSLLHASSLIGVPPVACLYVGDDLRDIQAAHAAGMKGLVAGYGYLGDGTPPAEWGADGLVDSPLGIATWIGLAPANRSAAAD